MAMNTTSKTAIITGAGSGISLSFATALLQRGCNVLIADLALRPEAEAIIAQYPLSSTGAKAVFQQTDVTDWAQLDRMFEVAVMHFGGVDIVCPGAGVYEPPSSNFWHPPGLPPSLDNPSQSRYTLLDINLTHPIRLTQLSITHFLTARKPGCVIHITSVAGQAPFFPTPMYVASKHAISGFVRSLARLEDPPKELGLPKIRVVAVAPARILTPLWTEQPDKMGMVGDEPGWVGPEVVARVMMDLVEGEENVGGTILEVGRRVRRVECYNDPGPSAGGNGVENGEGFEGEMWRSMKRVFDG